jgi:hypothetical protein
VHEHVCESVRRRGWSDCHLYTFGISNDYPYALELHDQERRLPYPQAGPVGVLPVQAGQRACTSIVEVAARMLVAAADAEWPAGVTTVPALMRWLGHSRLDVLKRDCEGCEYALAEGMIAQTNPDLFTRVDQLAVEVHVPRISMTTDARGRIYTFLFQQLEEGGHALACMRIWSHAAGPPRTRTRRT